MSISRAQTVYQSWLENTALAAATLAELVAIADDTV